MVLSPIQNYSLQSISSSHTAHFTTHALSPLGELSLASPLILACNGRHSRSWVPELSPSHNHSNSQCALRLELTPLVS
jgi:hypothetical protein